MTLLIVTTSTHSSAYGLPREHPGQSRSAAKYSAASPGRTRAGYRSPQAVTRRWPPVSSTCGTRTARDGRAPAKAVSGAYGRPQQGDALRSLTSRAGATYVPCHVMQAPDPRVIAIRRRSGSAVASRSASIPLEEASVSGQPPSAPARRGSASGADGENFRLLVLLSAGCPWTDILGGLAPGRDRGQPERIRTAGRRRGLAAPPVDDHRLPRRPVMKALDGDPALGRPEVLSEREVVRVRGQGVDSRAIALRHLELGRTGSVAR